MSKTIVCGVYGGPGIGKSSVAAEVFSLLKKQQISVELITEYAKDMTWQESYQILKNQIYVFAKQHNRVYRVLDKVDVIITDSPFILSIIYDLNQDSIFRNLVLSEFKKLHSLNFMLPRSTEYQTTGRYHTEQQAIEIDQKIQQLFEQEQIKYFKLRNLDRCATEIVSLIHRELKFKPDPIKIIRSIESSSKNSKG